jgi:hypothetical protein
LSHLEERALRATIEHATLARANLRRPARPPGFSILILGVKLTQEQYTLTF